MLEAGMMNTGRGKWSELPCIDVGSVVAATHIREPFENPIALKR